VSGENGIVFDQATVDISGMTEWTQNLLNTFPLEHWRMARQTNHRTLSACLAGVPWLSVLQPVRTEEACPFSGILVFDTMARRNFIRQCLIAAQIYPAILWSLTEPVVPPIPVRHIDFSQRMLSVHCDMRYTPVVLEQVAELIIQSGNTYDKGYD
jgi:hypothetical protein